MGLALCIPFVGILLSIAVFPLVKPQWWEAHQPIVVAIWSLLFIIPFAITNGVPEAVETVLECVIGDYLTFIVLLFGLKSDPGKYLVWMPRPLETILPHCGKCCPRSLM